MTRVALILAFLPCTMPGQGFYQNERTSFGPNGIHSVFSNFHGKFEVVIGAPYSADLVFEHTQRLTDNTVSQESKPLQHIWRDSQGRIRIERALIPQLPQGLQSRQLIQIFDPVAACVYILDDQNKVAHRVTIDLPAGNRQDVKGIGKEDTDGKEPIGMQTIEGVVVEGARQKVPTTPSSKDNDQPPFDVIETWYSRELKAMVLYKTTSAVDGENARKLINISRVEATPTLFQPPPDYNIVDDKDAVTLNLKPGKF